MQAGRHNHTNKITAKIVNKIINIFQNCKLSRSGHEDLGIFLALNCALNVDFTPEITAILSVWLFTLLLISINLVTYSPATKKPMFESTRSFTSRPEI